MSIKEDVDYLFTKRTVSSSEVSSDQNHRMRHTLRKMDMGVELEKNIDQIAEVIASSYDNGVNIEHELRKASPEVGTMQQSEHS